MHFELQCSFVSGASTGASRVLMQDRHACERIDLFFCVNALLDNFCQSGERLGLRSTTGKREIVREKKVRRAPIGAMPRGCFWNGYDPVCSKAAVGR